MLNQEMVRFYMDELTVDWRKDFRVRCNECFRKFRPAELKNGVCVSCDLDMAREEKPSRGETIDRSNRRLSRMVHNERKRQEETP